MKNILRLFVLGFLLSSLTGCVAVTGKRLGAVIDDTVIATSIKSKYIFNNDVHAFWIDVNACNGDVVLVGSVMTRGEEDIAILLAKSVEGVRSVTSFLKIKDQEEVTTSQETPIY